jgi:dTDP-4-dehydrorhamnose reductase
MSAGLDKLETTNPNERMNNLLITGGSGFVGKNLAKFFASRHTVATTYFQHAPSPYSDAQSFQLDVTNAEQVFYIFELVRPDAVIHAAGNKDVRFCEDHHDEAYRTNALGTRNVARACRKFGARMIYLSTDLVFNSLRGDYKENELPQPTLVYGRSKLQGERFALEELKDVAICRSGGIYGKGSPLLSWLSTELDAGRKVDCFVDIFNTPTYVENLAEMMETIIRKPLTGVFHTVGRERVSRFEFFQSYAGTFGLDEDLLSPVSVANMKERIFLQPDSSLSMDQTSKRLGIAFNSIREGFTRLKARGGI